MRTATRTLRYAVVYDITDDRERARVDKVLKGWGHRAQKSVFLVLLPRTSLERLKAQLDTVKPETGSILILRLQTGADILCIGLPSQDPDGDIAYII